MKAIAFLIASVFFAMPAFSQHSEDFIKTTSTVTINGDSYSLPKVTGPAGQRGVISLPVEIKSKKYELSVDVTLHWENDRLKYDLVITVDDKSTKVSISSKGATYPSEPLKYSFSGGDNKYDAEILFSMAPKD